jgi:hypothetical protein
MKEDWKTLLPAGVGFARGGGRQQEGLRGWLGECRGSNGSGRPALKRRGGAAAPSNAKSLASHAKDVTKRRGPKRCSAVR